MEDKQFAYLVELVPRATTAFQYAPSPLVQSVASVNSVYVGGCPVGTVSHVMRIKQ